MLFFNNEVADDAPEGYSTKQTWFYRMDMPDGYVHFSKSKPMKINHTEDIQAWWNNRQEIIIGENNIKSKSFSPIDLLDNGLNFDQCKFPKEEVTILTPEELLNEYWKKREHIDSKIDETLRTIECILGISDKG